jgi:hypothetical protein
MARTLSDFIETAVGFRAAVNVRQELDDFEKAAAFIPTKQAAEVLFDVGRQLEARAKERQRLITGTYGTGKSHLALVLAAIYRGHVERVETVFARLGQRHPGRVPQLRQDLAPITQERPFLVVVVEGDQDSFDAALVRELRQALERDGLAELMPSTFFSAAATRLRELEQDPDAGPRVKEAARALGLRSANELLEDLYAGELKSLDLFEQLHQRVCFDAPFFPETQIKAAETYAEAAGRLIAADRYAGIVVIWDEFGAFMERVVRDPGNTGLPIQQFAEACQNSGDKQLHLYLIAHRTLASYVQRMRDDLHLTPSMLRDWEQDFRKIEGRFHQFTQESDPEELFGLLDDVLIQQGKAGWDEFAQEHDNEFAALTDDAFKAELFPDLSSAKVRSLIIEGCHPLHPATATFLPRVSRIVAQNQRTLFTFLCGEHPGTVADFLRQTPVPGAGEPLRLVPADALWAYFEDALRGDQIGQQAYRRWRNALSVSAAEMSPDDDLPARLLRVLGLFELVRIGDPGRARELPATDAMLGFALDLRSEESRKALGAALKRLSQPGPNRVIVRNRDGVYQMVSGGTADLEERIAQTLEQRKATVNVAQFIRDRWAPAAKPDSKVRLGFMSAMEALRDGETVSRTVDVVPVLPEEIENLSPWLSDIGGGAYRDGYLFMVLPTDDPHLGAISKQALNYADNLQVIVARPSQPVRGLREVVARIDALEALEAQEKELWGEKGERREEWEFEYESTSGQLSQLLESVGPQHHARQLNLVCIWRGEPRSVRAWADLTQLADEAMAAAFPKTPKIRDEIVKQGARLRGLAPACRAVTDKLLQADGAKLLIAEPDQAQARLVRLLEGLGILQRGRRALIRRPDEEQDAGAAEAWDRIVDFRDTVREAPQPLESITNVLRSAPFGIGPGVLPLLIAAALRDDIRGGNLVLERPSRREEWETVQMDGTVLEEAVASPSKHRARYVDLSESQRRAIEGLLAAMAPEVAVPEPWSQLLDETKTQAAHWWRKLPQHCRQTQHLGRPSQLLRDEVIQPLCLPDTNAHEILVEKLRERVGDRPEWTREDFAAAFRQGLQEIQNACETLRERVAEEVATGLALEGEATPTGVTAGIRQWYASLPQATQDFCHPGDAGKLQRCLREECGEVLPVLAKEVMGAPLDEWGDATVGHFVGRLQGAKASVETWQPPAPAPSPELDPLPEGTARLVAATNVAGQTSHVRRDFTAIPTEQLGENAAMVLRLIMANLMDNPSLRDGERESIVLELVRRVFGNG